MGIVIGHTAQGFRNPMTKQKERTVSEQAAEKSTRMAPDSASIIAHIARPLLLCWALLAISCMLAANKASSSSSRSSRMRGVRLAEQSLNEEIVDFSLFAESSDGIRERNI